MKCLDENICINLIRKYFTFDTWNQVEMLIDVLKDKGCWICYVCLQPLTGKSIAMIAAWSGIISNVLG